jgi:hypothetical protein
MPLLSALSDQADSRVTCGFSDSASQPEFYLHGCFFRGQVVLRLGACDDSRPQPSARALTSRDVNLRCLTAVMVAV